MPGSAGERRNWGRRRARAWCTPTWWAPGGPRHGPCRRTCPLVASEHTPQARDAARRVDLFFASGPSACAWAARIGLDDGRLRDGRSSVEGLSAAALPGLPSPRLTFAGRLRGDKAPDVLIEALALIDAPPPAYLAGDGPLRGALTRLIRARGLEAVG
jgi:glycosyltransferase involved in cell wall biosynthesis